MKIVIIKKQIPSEQMNFYIQLERQKSCIERAMELKDMVQKEIDYLVFSTSDPDWDNMIKIVIKCRGLGIDSRHITTEPSLKEISSILDQIVDRVFRLPKLTGLRKQHEKQTLYTYYKTFQTWLEHLLFERPDLLK